MSNQKKHAKNAAYLSGASNGARLVRQDGPVSLFQASSPSAIPNMPPLAAGNKDLARIVYTETTLNITGSELEVLLRDYNRLLIQNGFGMARKELRKLNMIDTRNLIIPPSTKWEAPMPHVTLEEKLFLISDYWYGFIPCFEEGVLHINQSRYIYWKIKEIAMDHNRMDIFLQDYIWYDNTGWQPGVCGVITWSFEDPVQTDDLSEIQHRLQTKYAIVDNRPDYPTPHEDYSTIYHILDYKNDLKWNSRNIDMWERTIVRYALEAKERFVEGNKQSMLETLARLFTSYILKINKALSDNKIQKSRAVPSDQKPAKQPMETQSAQPQNPQPEQPAKKRRIRTIGPLEITSQAVPKASTRKSITHYSVASWTRRGHIRTYKNGKNGVKKVYVRESTAYRKALQQKEPSPDASIPTTIKFRKRKEQQDDNP